MSIKDVLRSDATTPEFYEFIVVDESGGRREIFVDIGAAHNLVEAGDFIKQVSENSTAVLHLYHYPEGSGPPRLVWSVLIDHPEDDLTDVEFVKKVYKVFQGEEKKGWSQLLHNTSIMLEAATGVDKSLWRMKRPSMNTWNKTSKQRLLMLEANSTKKQ